MKPLLSVVAAVIFNERGEILLSSRPEGKAYAGYWEFAGGKVEAGESERAALARELQEELGIHLHHATPWLSKIHHYQHASVLLRFFRVLPHQWTGSLQCREQQQYAWQQAGRFDVSPMLPANNAILRALALPFTLSGSQQDGWQGQNGVGVVRMGFACTDDIVLLQAAALAAADSRLQLRPLNLATTKIDMDDGGSCDGWWWQPNNVAEVDALLTTLHQGYALPIVALLSPKETLFAQRLQDAGIHIAVTTDVDVLSR